MSRSVPSAPARQRSRVAVTSPGLDSQPKYGLAALAQPRSLLFVGCLIAQAATLFVTWPLWQLRDDPPALPLIEGMPIAFSMGWWMLASLAFSALAPKPGLWLHGATLLLASAMDQMRLQPQFFVLVVLMAACVYQPAARFCRWFLVSTWLWAGLHKLLSPDWFGAASWWMVARMGLDAEATYLPFAWGIAFGELAVGLAACFRPRWAAWMCVGLHVGIVITLSPLAAHWNESVIPWNLAMAAVGFWVMQQAARDERPVPGEMLLAAALIIYPLGFYGGWVDHGFAGVLYSDCLPRGQITRRTGTTEIDGWGELAVPFPNERRLLRQHFAAAAQPGDKLHISDPRPWLDDQYFLLGPQDRLQEIDADRFFAAGEGEVAGVGLDRRRSIFALSRAGARLLRASDEGPIYAIEFPPGTFDPRQLAYLEGLPNLQQVQLSGTRIRDEDLPHLPRLQLLSAIELYETAVTAAGLRDLERMPALLYIGHESRQSSAVVPAASSPE